jgi:hypothetical protein
MNKTTAQIELAIAYYFGIRENLIVPNVSWGLNLHECDMIVLSRSGYATEIEIKVSASDLKKDSKKRHGHVSNKIKYLYFAIPSKLCKYIEYIPEHAGILVVTSKARVHEIAKPRPRPNHIKFNTELRYDLARLGSIRIWGLKQKILDLKNKLEQEKEI